MSKRNILRIFARGVIPLAAVRTGEVGEGLLVRHTRWVRTAHLIHLASFLGLLLTGLFVYSMTLNHLVDNAGVMVAMRYAHRVLAVIFIAGGIFFLARREDRESLRRYFFRREPGDWSFFRVALPWIFGRPVDMPAQGKYNGGQKFLFGLVLAGSAVLAVTGILMWWKGPVPPQVVAWCYPLHDLAAIGLAAVVLAHIYLGVLFPSTRHTWRSMFQDGMVRAAYARDHYRLWYDEMTQGKEGDRS